MNNYHEPNHRRVIRAIDTWRHVAFAPTELSLATGVSLATVKRILVQLVKLELLTRTPNAKRPYSMSTRWTDAGEMIREFEIAKVLS